MTNTVECDPARVLAVDDETNVREVLKLVLEGEGWTVEEAGSGTEALERCRSGRYDFMVLDEQMPDLTGMEVVAALSREGLEVPIVIFSAYLDPEVEAACAALRLHTVDKCDWPTLIETCRHFERGRRRAVASDA